MSYKTTVRMAIAAAFAAAAVSFAPVHKASADAEFFPVSPGEVETMFEVIHDPNDSCFEIIRDTSGWEVHGTWFDIHSIGSRHLGVTVDVNKQLPYMLSPNFKPFGNTPGQRGQGKRFTLDPNEVGTAWVEGGCGFGMSIYPGAPAQACESVNNPCPGGSVATQPQTSVQVVPVAQNTTPTTSAEVTIEEVQGFCPACAGRLSYLHEDPNDATRNTAVKFLIGGGSCVDINVPDNINVQGWDGTKIVGGHGQLHLCEATFRRRLAA